MRIQSHTWVGSRNLYISSRRAFPRVLKGKLFSEHVFPPLFFPNTRADNLPKSIIRISIINQRYWKTTGLAQHSCRVSWKLNVVRACVEHDFVSQISFVLYGRCGTPCWVRTSDFLLFVPSLCQLCCQRTSPGKPSYIISLLMGGIANSLTTCLSAADSGTPYSIVSASPSGLISNSARTSPQIRTLDRMHSVPMFWQSGYRSHLIHVREPLQFMYVLEFHLLSEKRIAENFRLWKL